MKRFIEGVSGKGGLESFVLWMDQLDFVPNLSPLLNSISHKLMFYDTALTKCAKESLKRPEFVREEEIGAMLGYCCSECGKTQSALDHREKKLCECGGRYVLTYLLVHKQLRAINVVPVPEAVMMTVAYDGLADAYVEAYVAFKRVLSAIIEQRGWSNANQFVDNELKDRLDYSFYYGEPGDQRISREEREILQFLVRGNLADIGVAEAEKLIRLGIGTCKFGHLFNQLFCAGADAQYNFIRVQFSMLYNEVNAKIRMLTSVSRAERERRTVEILELKEKQYYPCLFLHAGFWKHGRLSHHIVLKPLTKIPIFTTASAIGLTCVVGPSGCGKTSMMDAFIGYSIESKHMFVFNILGDEANSLTLSCLPMFHFGGHTKAFLGRLKEMKVKPHGVPCLNLTFVRDEKELNSLNRKNTFVSNPPTIFDRVVMIDDPNSFGFEFKTGRKATVESVDVVGNRGVLDILSDFSEKMGYQENCGVVNVRNLRRTEHPTKDAEIRPDIQIATNLLEKFANFRQSSKYNSMGVADELSYLAPIQYRIAGRDTSKSSAMMGETIKQIRKGNTSFLTATQKYSEIDPELKSEALNVLFRELPKSRDKAKSQRDIVLGSLDLMNGKAEEELVASVMERGVFPHNAFYWFWWNKHRKTVEVVKPSPPFFMINQPRKTNLEIFKAYEKATGKTVLLKSWRDVPCIRYESSEYAGRFERRAK